MSATLKRLLLVLLDNAVKYTPEGGRCEIILARTDGRAEIIVRDSGIGIPASELPNIFDRFYRVDPVRTKTRSGAGLGLAIARWIVEMHEGSIVAESSLGCGSSFHVSLPSPANQFVISPRMTSGLSLSEKSSSSI